MKGKTPPFTHLEILLKPAQAVLGLVLIKSPNRKNPNWWGDDTPHKVMGGVTINGLSAIKSWRVFLRLTQQQVADNIGMQQSAYARIENSKTPPKRSTVEKIAKGLGVSLEQLEF